MLKTYKNLLFKNILNKGLEINHFKFIEQNPAFSQIIYKDTPLFFNIYVHPESHHHFKIMHTKHTPMFNLSSLIPSDFRPDYIPVEKTIHYENWLCMNFDNVITCFNYWYENDIESYNRNLDIPDEWEMYLQGNKILSLDENTNTNKFSKEQLKNVSVKLNEFKLFILKEYSPNSEQLNIIEEKINYLIDAANRNTVFDWKNIAMAILINIASTLMLDSEKAMQMFNFFKSLFIAIIFLPN